MGFLSKVRCSFFMRIPNYSNLAILESPLQLTNFLALSNLSGLSLCLIRCPKTSSSVRQFAKLIAANSIDVRIYTYEHTSKTSWFFCFFRMLCCLLFYRVRGCKSIIYGDARSVTYKFTNKWLWRERFLVDDGLYLVDFAKRFSHKLAGISIYTSLPIGNIPNAAVTSVSRCNLMSVEIREEVWFIGSKLVDAKIISKESFQVLMERVVQYFSTFAGEFVYVAHREESEQALMVLAGLGVKVKKFDLPIEEYLSEANSGPAVIASFYSTALYNLAGGKISSVSFLLPKSYILWNQQAIQSVYAVFKDDPEIELVEL